MTTQRSWQMTGGCRRSIVSLVSLVFLAASLSACGDSSEDDPAPSASIPEASLVPASIRDAGVIKVGSSFAKFPMYYLDNDKPTGALVEMIDEAAKRLGLKTEWTQYPYTGLLVALEAKKIDVMGDQMTRTEDNSGEAHFVGAWKTASGIITRTETQIDVIEDVCGKVIGVSAQPDVNTDVMNAIASECEAAGEPAPTLKRYADANAQFLAVQSGNVDGSIYTSDSQVEQVKEVGDGKEFKVAFQAQLAPRITSFALGKDDEDLSAALQAAIESMIADGTYATIFESNDVADHALGEPNVPLDADIPPPTSLLPDA